MVALLGRVIVVLATLDAAIVTASGIANGAATELEQCAVIEADMKRLACYDALAGSSPHRNAGEPDSVSSPAGANPEEDGVAIEAQSQSGNKYLRAEREAGGTPSAQLELVAAYKDSRRRWVFEFSDGQVWRQLESGYLPKPDALPSPVTVSKGIFGTYNLRAGYISKTVKVKRLQ